MVNLLRLLFSGCTSEIIETDAKPTIDTVVQLKVFIANLLRRQVLGQSLGFRCRAVLVRAADVQCIVVGHTCVSECECMVGIN